MAARLKPNHKHPLHALSGLLQLRSAPAACSLDGSQAHLERSACSFSPHPESHTWLSLQVSRLEELLDLGLSDSPGSPMRRYSNREATTFPQEVVLAGGGGAATLWAQSSTGH